jgi:hypothetical protein
MAELIDEETLEQSTKTPEELEAELAAQQQQAPETNDDPQDDIPDKYQGKSIKEVIAMHQEAEKVIGRNSGEVGELRQLVDTYIQNQTESISQQQVQAETPPEAPDFFEDPTTAVSQAIANHPDVVAARESVKGLQQQTAASQVNEKHPDAKEIVKDPAFVEYVKSSPVRTELFIRADRESDVAAADELLSGFKSRQGVARQAAENDATARRAQLNSANTGNARGSSAPSSDKIYKRADIIRLMRERPDVYEANAMEIQKAYAEGRVRTN